MWSKCPYQNDFRKFPIRTFLLDMANHNLLVQEINMQSIHQYESYEEKQ